MSGFFPTDFQLADDGPDGRRWCCTAVRQLLWPLIDGELSAGHARSVLAHLTICPACVVEHRLRLEVRAALRHHKCRCLSPAARRRILAKVYRHDPAAEPSLPPRPTLRA
jgi:anti-sigma factor RsiW